MHSSAQVHRSTSDQSFSIKIARRKIVKDHCAFENEISKSTMERGSVKKTQEGWLPSKGIYARRTREMGDPAWYWVTINERAMGWRYTRWGKALAGRNRRVEAIEVTVESSSNGAFGTTAEEPFAKMSISFDLIEKN